MSYTPTMWTTGDTITATALNKIENGIANAGGVSFDLIVNIDFTNYTGTIEIGNFNSVLAKLETPTPVLGLAKWLVGDEYQGGGCSLIYDIHYDDEYADPAIVLTFVTGINSPSSWYFASDNILHTND